MSTSDTTPVPERVSAVDKDGVRGWIEGADRTASPDKTARVVVRTEEGRVFAVPRDLFVKLPSGGYGLTVSFAELAARQPATRSGGAADPSSATSDPSAVAADPAAAAPLVVPVLAETLVVTKRPVVTGRVRLTKRVRSQEKIIDETVQVERAEVERVPINRFVETAPLIRYEGDTMVIPVVEEVVVVEKRLMLREELRVTKRHSAERINRAVVVRSEEVSVQRFDSSGRERQADGE